MHSDASKADDALKSLQRVEPNADHEIETLPLDPEMKAVWGSIGAWDFVTSSLINYRRKWVWEKDITPELPKIKEDEPIDRFVWVTLGTTEETDMLRFFKPFKKLVLRGQIDNKVVVSK